MKARREFTGECFLGQISTFMHYKWIHRPYVSPVTIEHYKTSLDLPCVSVRSNSSTISFWRIFKQIVKVRCRGKIHHIELSNRGVRMLSHPIELLAQERLESIINNNPKARLSPCALIYLFASGQNKIVMNLLGEELYHYARIHCRQHLPRTIEYYCRARERIRRYRSYACHIVRPASLTTRLTQYKNSKKARLDRYGISTLHDALMILRLRAERRLGQ